MSYRLLLEIPPPRKVRPTSAVKTSYLTFAILAVLAVLVAVGTESIRMGTKRALAQHGRVTQASVYDKYSSSKGGRTLSYEFFVDNKRFTGDKKVTQDEFDRARTGDPVTVTYLPEKPQVQLTGEVTQQTVDNEREVLVLLILVLLIAESFGGIILWLLIRRDLRLMERGVAVEGEIVSINPRASNNQVYYSTNFTYMLEDKVVLGSLSLTASEGRGRKQGDRMILLVDPATPKNPRLPESLKFAESPDLAILKT